MLEKSRPFAPTSGAGTGATLAQAVLGAVVAAAAAVVRVALQVDAAVYAQRLCTGRKHLRLLTLKARQHF